MEAEKCQASVIVANMVMVVEGRERTYFDGEEQCQPNRAEVRSRER